MQNATRYKMDFLGFSFSHLLSHETSLSFWWLTKKTAFFQFQPLQLSKMWLPSDEILHTAERNTEESAGERISEIGHQAEKL